MSSDDHDLIAERRRKLEQLRAAGAAFPNDFRRNALAEELHRTFGSHDNKALEEAGVVVAIAGRMMAKRLMGKSSFVPLQDRSGRIQLFLQRDALPAGVYQDFKTWDVGDIVAAEGPLFRTNTGELSVRASELRLLTKSLRPLPEKFHGLTDRETRYRRRYVDLIMNESSRRVFRLRAAAVDFIRDALKALGFLEVETPMMQAIPGGALARPFETHHHALDMKLYLRIAPELYLKRLVVGGFERVFEINRNFRNEGISTQHNPEFTMLELYQAYADYRDIMHLTETLIRSMAETLLQTSCITYQGAGIDFGPEFRRLTVEDAICAHNPHLERDKLREVTYLRDTCARLGIPCPSEYGPGKLQIEIFEKTVEHHLRAPTFITALPAEVSPLSRCNDADPFLTDRFELFIAGRELANGFSELNDAEEQSRRFREQAARKAGGDEEAMFYDADYVRALEYGLPPTGGLGVGIDRLVMLLTDAPSIRDVLLFPLLRPEAD